MKLRVAMGHTTRIIRQQKSYTLRDVSQRSGISLAHLSEFERGIKEMSSELLTSLATGLQINQSDIILEAYRMISKEEQREAKRVARSTD
jgi:transcriptional regulator with XRE-family HTH domain